MAFYKWFYLLTYLLTYLVRWHFWCVADKNITICVIFLQDSVHRNY